MLIPALGIGFLGAGGTALCTATREEYKAAKMRVVKTVTGHGVKPKGFRDERGGMLWENKVTLSAVWQTQEMRGPCRLFPQGCLTNRPAPTYLITARDY